MPIAIVVPLAPVPLLVHDLEEALAFELLARQRLSLDDTHQVPRLEARGLGVEMAHQVAPPVMVDVDAVRIAAEKALFVSVRAEGQRARVDLHRIEIHRGQEHHGDRALGLRVEPGEPAESRQDVDIDLHHRRRGRRRRRYRRLLYRGLSHRR